jgi:hypothetical protein
MKREEIENTLDNFFIENKELSKRDFLILMTEYLIIQRDKFITEVEILINDANLNDEFAYIEDRPIMSRKIKNKIISELKKLKVVERKDENN